MSDQTNNDQVDADVDVDLQKSLDDQLAEMNEKLLKSKKPSVSDDEMKEMMKNEKFKEYMKKEGYSKKEKEETEDGDEGEDTEDKMKKSFANIYEEHGEVIDAIPVLKSFSKVLETVNGQVKKIENAVGNLQKSLEENIDLQKSFGGVVGAQSELIKSISDEIEAFGNVPGKVKGKINKEDLVKSVLADEDAANQTKLTSSNVEQVRSVLLKSVQDKEISSMSVSKWEQGGYNMGVFSQAELAKIESKL